MNKHVESPFLSNKQASIIFNRDNGTIVELVATYFPDFRSNKSIRGQFDYYALVRKDGEDLRVVTPENSSNKSLNGLSIDEYIKSGRVGLMAVVRPHEMFKVADKLFNKLTLN